MKTNRNLWVTREDLAELLGLSPSQISELLKRFPGLKHVWGRTEGSQYGGVVRYYLPEIELWLQRYKAV